MHGGPSQGGHSHQSKAPPLGSGRGLETMPEDDGDDTMVRCMACWWACSTCHVVECTADSVVSAYHDVGLLSRSTPKLQYPPHPLHPPPLFRYDWGDAEGDLCATRLPISTYVATPLYRHNLVWTASFACMINPEPCLSFFRQCIELVMKASAAAWVPTLSK